MMNDIFRQALRQRKWRVVSAMAATLFLLSLHFPNSERVTLRFAGDRSKLPERYTVFEEMGPTWEIPLVSSDLPHYVLMDGWQEGLPTYTSRSYAIHPTAVPGGVTFEIATARMLSITGYRAANLTLLVESGEDAEGPAQLPRDPAGHDTEAVQNGVHILDLGRPSSFVIPLRTSPPGGEVSIDFNPLLYTKFKDIHDGQSIGVPHDCQDTLFFSVGIPRTVRYEISAQPPPQPGQPSPPGERTEVFLVDKRWILDRMDQKSWNDLRARTISSNRVHLKHDPATKEITLEVTSPPKPPTRPRGSLPTTEEPLPQRNLVLVAGTPSADHRDFGIDCVALSVENRKEFNPVLETVFDDLEGARVHVWGDKLLLTPGVAQLLRYHTTWRDGSPTTAGWNNHYDKDIHPKAEGQTQVFLVDGRSVEHLDVIQTPDEWQDMQKRAIHPTGVLLAHDATKNTISITLNGSLRGTYAIMAGTPSTDGRFFWVDWFVLQEQVEPTKPPAPDEQQ